MDPKSNIPGVFRNAIFLLLFICNVCFIGAQCPTIADPNPPPICDASGFTFNDLGAYASGGGSSVRWYGLPSGGAPFSANQFVTEGTYYADRNSGTCGTRPSITINFQVSPSGKNLDRIYCTNENPTVQTYIDDVLISSIPVGGSVVVYYNSSLTNQASSLDPIPLGATNLYSVFIDNAGCESQIEIGQVGVFTAPDDPNPPSLQSFCSASNPTVADLVPGTTETDVSWYEDLDGAGDPVLPAFVPNTPLADGNTYYVQVNDIFCDSNPIPVQVSIDVSLNAGTSTNLNYCENNLPVSDFNLFDELGGSPDITGTWTGPSSTTNGYQGTVNISAFTTGSYVFTYTVQSTSTCADEVSTITININELNTSGTANNPSTYCENNLPISLDLFGLLNNEDSDGQWTLGLSSSDPVVTSPINLTTFSPGTYNFTYTQNLAPSFCLEESTTVQVNILADPNAGNAVDQTFCENEIIANSPFDLFNALDGSQDNNVGSWTDPTNNNISNIIDITGFTVTGSPYLFIYTVDNGTCLDTEQISIIIEESPESGTPNATFPEFCEGTAPSNYDLFQLIEGENPSGTWYNGTDNTGTTTVNPIDLSILSSGAHNFTFDVDAIGSCDDELVTVQIIINPQPITGTPSNVIFCENDLIANSPLNLFDQISGENTGGTWTDDDTSGALNGSELNLTLLSIGTYNYTYTIDNGNDCKSSSTVNITIQEVPESGTSNPAAEYCEGTAPSDYNLFDLLENEDTTGTWYIGSDNTGTITSNILNVSSFVEGTYNYTYDVDAIGSCDDDLITVKIIINPSPMSGTASNATFCENDLAGHSPLNLLDQLDGEDAGGTWTDNDASEALSGSNLDLTSLSIGTYTYTYLVTNSSDCTSSSTVSITIQTTPESGTPNAPAIFCASQITSGQTYNLFDLLSGEDESGVWSDDNSSGALSGNTVALNGLASGNYNFTFNVDAVGSCDDVNQTVTITIYNTTPPTAPTSQIFCDSATVADLTATGTILKWYANNSGGAPLNTTDELTDGQSYFVSQTDSTTNCESSLRTQVNVTINPQPNAGNPNSNTIATCNNSIVNLIDGLDGTQDTGGIWMDDDSTGAVSGDTFDAAVVSAGTYNFTYLLTGISPCADDSTTITVIVENSSNPGTSNIVNLCATDSSLDLFPLLGGADSGGTWSPILTSNSGVFDPSIDAAGDYTYTLNNSCGPTSATVTVNVTQPANAGGSTTADICIYDAPTDLFGFLGTADSGGTWSPALSSGTGVFDPAIDTAGTYTYSVSSVAPCAAGVSAEITVIVHDVLPLTVLDSNPEFCLSNNPTVADLDNSVQSTGNIKWYQDADLAILLNASEDLTNGAIYYGTQTNNAGCESIISVEIEVIINDLPTPTLIDPSIDYCINDGPTIADLSLNIAEYIATENNVVWYDAAIGGSTISNDSALSPTTYYASLLDPITGCESSVRFMITPVISACGDLVIPDGFSPNGDGINDTFDMDNVSILYPNFEMEIYNRNGNIVYKGDANTPRFNGTSNQSRIALNGELPVGVYFYIFRFNDNVNSPKQGRLYLNR